MIFNTNSEIFNLIISAYSSGDKNLIKKKIIKKFAKDIITFEIK